MAVRRIVPNLKASDPELARKFYQELLDLDVVMDHGWILTFAADVTSSSIEVDDVDIIYQRAKAAGLEIPYDISNEPWGVRRFYVCDPFGNIVNILSHG
jgi:predicted enzyme related to lactoylglutathione lyase